MKKLSLLGLGCVLAFGCGDDDDRPADSGRPMLMDASMMTDTGGGGEDSGPAMCPPVMAPPPAMGACDEAAVNEFGAVASQPAFEAWCNTHRGCCGCLDTNFISCGSTMGCAQELGNVECCIQAACGGAADQAAFDTCVGQQIGAGGGCRGELETFLECIPAGCQISSIPEVCRL